MIRIVVPLILALVAYFGPWSGGISAAFSAGNSADATLACIMALDLPTSPNCLPSGDLSSMLIGYTSVLGVVAAVLSILGLLPLVGRLTSVAVIAAGGVGIAAAGMIIAGALGDAGIGAVGWGAWGSLVLGLITVFLGFGGLRGEGGSDY
jgi:hypothetical protein